MRLLRLLPAAALLLLAGCFPLELDVKDGKLLIARQEGFFVFDPAKGTVVKVWGTEGGKPAFARFAPDGKHILAVLKTTGGLNKYRFVLAPLDGKGKPRQLFEGEDTGYVLFSPDGNHVAIARGSEKEHPQWKERVPQLHLISVKDGSDKVIARNVGVLFRWFADSKRVMLFEVTDLDKQRRFHGTLSILNVADGKKTALAAALGTQQMHFDLSPDGKRVLFTALDAGKPGAALKAEGGFGFGGSLKLFDLDVTSGEVRNTGREARYAVFSPKGDKVLLGSMPRDFGAEGLTLEVADVADLKKTKTLAPDAYVQQGFGADTGAYPGWVSDTQVFYFTSRAVYGTEGRSVHLFTVGVDGKNRRPVQPTIDLEAMKDEK